MTIFTSLLMGTVLVITALSLAPLFASQAREFGNMPRTSLFTIVVKFALAMVAIVLYSIDVIVRAVASGAQRT